MKWLLSWFGLWVWVEVSFSMEGQLLRLGVWTRPWDSATREKFRRGHKALEDAGWDRSYNMW